LYQVKQEKIDDISEVGGLEQREVNGGWKKFHRAELHNSYPSERFFLRLSYQRRYEDMDV
jgi:hypothetical protein